MYITTTYCNTVVRAIKPSSIDKTATMVFTLTIPNEYGWVILGAGIGSAVCNIVLGGPVMKGRKNLDVPLPNLYATPGVHKHADEFNRIQRSHQNYMEMLDSYIAMTLLGGLKYPLACAVGSEYCTINTIPKIYNIYTCNIHAYNTLNTV